VQALLVEHLPDEAKSIYLVVVLASGEAQEFGAEFPIP
jgi:hypothetical protein